ncbi:glycylpeptide N-tetradecanoyltransferase [Asimina triloba]
MWQAAYTAGVVLPTPITTCQYWHPSLNRKKLIDVGFSRLGAQTTMSRTIKLYKLPEYTSTPGFQKMELRDAPAVTRLLRNYLSQFVVAPDFDEDDIEHWLLPTENVVDSYLAPLRQLVNDMLIVAKQKDYDVFNALDVMHNESFLKELKFGPGDGQLHYCLYNYGIRHPLKSSELGLVLS